MWRFILTPIHLESINDIAIWLSSRYLLHKLPVARHSKQSLDLVDHDLVESPTE